MFFAPYFLLGLLAIGLPIWLHRVARANPVRHTFPSLMLLEQAETQRTARRTLRYWLLLLLRILLLVLLALAFAGPLLRKDENAALAANARLHAIVLDASLSMQHGDRWQNALRAVESVLESVRSADQVMLVRASGRRMDIVQEALPAREAGTLRARLGALAPGRDRLDFGFAMSSAEQWLRTPRPPVLLHVISDFQASAAPLRFADLEPPAGSQLVMHDVGGERDNVYIGSLRLSPGDTRSVEVEVLSSFAEPQQREVVLLIDGKEHARRMVQLAGSSERAARLSVVGEGGGRVGAEISQIDSPTSEDEAQPQAATAVFENLPLEAGSHRVEARLVPNDSLIDDDRYFAVLEHADPQALLLTRNADADEGAYFAAAIGALSAPRVNVTLAPAGGLQGNGGFQNYAVLVVPDIFAVSSATATLIEQYVSAGGALLTTLGAARDASEHPLLPGWRFEKPRPRLARIGAVDGSHPILRDAPEWHRVRFFRQRPVRVPDEDRVLISYADGTPLLVERTLGAGRILVLTAPIDRQWNDLAIHPAFVQFISQATRYLIGGDSALASVTVGAPVTTGLTAQAGGQIFDPNGNRVLGLGAAANAERIVPSEIGFYEIRHASGARWLAVNTDRRESDLRQLEPDYLARWQALRQRPARTPTPATANVESTQTRLLGHPLLWVAALLLLAELLMANRYLAVRREVAR